MNQAHTHEITLKAAMVCDDIRIERSGKYIAIGIYANSLELAAFPTTLVLAMLVHADTPKRVETSVEFRVQLNGKAVTQTGGNLAVKEPGVAILPVGNLVIAFDGPGELEIHGRVASDDWTPLTSLSVKLREPT